MPVLGQVHYIDALAYVILIRNESCPQGAHSLVEKMRNIHQNYTAEQEEVNGDPKGGHEDVEIKCCRNSY